jgi:hypothetical protein
LNPILDKILFTPHKLILIHVALGLLFALFPQLFIPFFYLLTIISFTWIFSNNKYAKNTSLVVVVFFYLMMFESVSRILALDPLIPWELGKYLTILFVVYLLYKHKIRASSLVILAVFLILAMLIKGVTWKGFFFNTTLFFGLLLTQDSFKSIRFNKFQLLRLLQTIILPLFVFLGASINQIQDFQNRQYELDSNSILDKIPSNQVATYMGFAFFLSLIPFYFNKGYSLKWTSYIAPAAFLLVGLLSFSRGGMITAVIGLLVISLGNVISGKLNYLVYFMLFLVISIPVGFYINEVTGGNLFLRYQGETRGTLVGSKEKTLDTYTTGRVSIFIGDWETFKNNWLFGVEIGESQHYRKETELQQSHVEFSRILAEHGFAGLIAFIILVINGFYTIKKSAESKRIKYLMFAIWTIGFVTTWHGATRTILPFIFMSIPIFAILGKPRINWPLDVKN